MPACCCVVGCKSRGGKDSVRFFRLPAVRSLKYRTDINELSRARRDAWVRAINRKNLLDYKNLKVCGKHFLSGAAADLEDVENPDWVPNTNLGYKSILLSKEGTFKRYLRRMKRNSTTNNNEAPATTVTAKIPKISQANLNQSAEDVKPVQQTPETVVTVVSPVKEEVEMVKNPVIKNVNDYTVRTATCGELNSSHVGQKVILCGWMEFQRMEKFLLLRDAYGATQVLIDHKNDRHKSIVKNLNYEAALKISGTVVERPKIMINRKQATGEIEVQLEDITVLNNPPVKLPFNIREYQKAHEALRMHYRYLDLRFPEMQRNLRMRSNITMKMREFLIKESGFVDVETPTLFKATPGGAQEFIVPTRHKGQFYSLVQSPQQFKQMLMCGGIDRYFQIARCYRDETSRPDRQPEFTQLDIEMSFTTMYNVLKLAEDLLNYALKDTHELSEKFPRMSFAEAMNSYGTDKPDISFESRIINVTDILLPFVEKDSSFKSKYKEFFAGCLVFGEPHNNVKPKNNVNHWPKTVMYHTNKDKSAPESAGKPEKTSNILNDLEILTKIYQHLNISGNATVYLILGEKSQTLQRLGKMRLDTADILESKGHKIRKEGLHFLWIVDFPLFSLDDKGNLCSEHHPFTAPVERDISKIANSPLKVRALSYDLVLNGSEIGGGSMRIHDAKLQADILRKLNIEGLDHIVEMLSYGCPPHGGIALGLDRLLSILLGTKTIRDVIAFPKTFEGKEPISGAPSEISNDIKKLYHLDLAEEST